jgi:hypothetical protein
MSGYSFTDACAFNKRNNLQLANAIPWTCIIGKLGTNKIYFQTMYFCRVCSHLTSRWCIINREMYSLNYWLLETARGHPFHLRKPICCDIWWHFHHRNAERICWERSFFWAKKEEAGPIPQCGHGEREVLCRVRAVYVHTNKFILFWEFSNYEKKCEQISPKYSIPRYPYF